MSRKSDSFCFKPTSDKVSECIEVKDCSWKCVAMRYIGYNNGGAGFTHVPIDPEYTFGMSEAVVCIQDCCKDLQELVSLLLSENTGTYDKYTQSKYSTD